MSPPPIFKRGNEGGGKGDALDRTPLLALLEPDLRQRVRKRLNRRKIGSGKPLYRQGETADALYLVESGRFRVFVGERVGQERVLRFLGPGELAGEAAFMAETPHVTNAVAVDDASVWRLARTDFEALLGKHDGLLRYLASSLPIASRRPTRAWRPSRRRMRRARCAAT